MEPSGIIGLRIQANELHLPTAGFTGLRILTRTNVRFRVVDAQGRDVENVPLEVRYSDEAGFHQDLFVYHSSETNERAYPTQISLQVRLVGLAGLPGEVAFSLQDDQLTEVTLTVAQTLQRGRIIRRYRS